MSRPTSPNNTQKHNPTFYKNDLSLVLKLNEQSLLVEVTKYIEGVPTSSSRTELTQDKIPPQIPQQYATPFGLLSYIFKHQKCEYNLKKIRIAFPAEEGETTTEKQVLLELTEGYPEIPQLIVSVVENRKKIKELQQKLQKKQDKEQLVTSIRQEDTSVLRSYQSTRNKTSTEKFNTLMEEFDKMIQGQRHIISEVQTIANSQNQNSKKVTVLQNELNNQKDKQQELFKKIESVVDNIDGKLRGSAGQLQNLKGQPEEDNQFIRGTYQMYQMRKNEENLTHLAKQIQTVKQEMNFRKIAPFNPEVSEIRSEENQGNLSMLQQKLQREINRINQALQTQNKEFKDKFESIADSLNNSLNQTAEFHNAKEEESERKSGDEREQNFKKEKSPLNQTDISKDMNEMKDFRDGCVLKIQSLENRIIKIENALSRTSLLGDEHNLNRKSSKNLLMKQQETVNKKLIELQAREKINEIQDMGIDAKFLPLDQFEFKGREVTYLAQDNKVSKVFSFTPIAVKNTCSIKIIKSKQCAIQFGIIDVRCKAQKASSNSHSIRRICYSGKSGEIHETGRGHPKKEGDGFQEGDTITMTVNLSVGNIKWLINSKHKINYYSPRMREEPVEWVPYFTIRHQKDAIEFYG